MLPSWDHHSTAARKLWHLVIDVRDLDKRIVLNEAVRGLTGRATGVSIEVVKAEIYWTTG